MLSELLRSLIEKFRTRLASHSQELTLETYLDAALKLDDKADVLAAKCWVNLFSEALRSPSLFSQVKRYLDAEVEKINQLTENKTNSYQSSAVLAYIFGSLVFGSFAPKRTVGFSSPMAKILFKEFI